MRIFGWITCLLIAASLAPAQRITAITNAASYVLPTLPNEGVAQGAMFVIKGTGLGPATFAVASTFPLLTTIGGSSVSVTVGGTTVNAIMYYAGATQVAAILPSSTPLGDATAVVRYNGQASPAFRFKVVRNAFGVFTVPQSGMGDAIASLGSTFVSPLNAANAGDIVAFWGTGLGAVAGNEADAATQVDLTIPVEAFVGGKPAEVLFRGRNACCSSVDNVYIKIPEGVAGCATPVLFKIGSVVSNSVTIPAASSGRICTPAHPAISSARAAELYGKQSVAVGTIDLWGSNQARTPANPNGTNTPQVDQGFGRFWRFAMPPGALGLGPMFDIHPMGSCDVLTFPTIGGPGLAVTGQWLDAGDRLTLQGTAGQRTLGRRTTPSGSLTYAGSLATPAFFTGGAFTASAPGATAAANGIGAFSVTSAQAPALIWTLPTAAPTVTREQGFTVNWTGGDPNGWVEIGIAGNSSDNLDVSAEIQIICNARTSAGTFTIPPAYLMAMPPSPPQSVTLTWVHGYSQGTLFQPAGIDLGVMTVGNQNVNIGVVVK